MGRVLSAPEVNLSRVDLSFLVMVLHSKWC